MSSLPLLPSGVYQHYKGPLYFVFGYGHDANVTVCVNDINGDGDCAACARNPEALCRQPRSVVVYMGLQLDGAHKGPRLAVRTADDFHARVHPADGTVCSRYDQMDKHYCHCPDRVSSRTAARFTYLGPTWEN